MPTLLTANNFDVSIQGVLTDIDDTLTAHGKLQASTFKALEALALAGFKVIPVTGRSSGWAHMILSQWPVDAVIAESGAVSLTRGVNGSIKLALADENGAKRRPALMALCKDYLAEHFPLAFASDNDFRLVDVAIDYAEAVNAKPEQVQHAIAFLKHQGFNAKASSIHINAWSGQFDKGPTAQTLVAQLFPTITASQWLCVGDAPNDQSLFECFTNSVGVANIAPCLPAMQHRPKWITTASYGEGFEELAAVLLGRRGK